MRIHLSYVAASLRSTGAVEILVQAGYLAAGGDVSKVMAAYEAFRDPENGELREEYSHVLLVLDNQMREQHEFPSGAVLAKAETERLEELVRAAKRVKDREESIEREAKAKSDAARKRLRDAEGELRRLGSESKAGVESKVESRGSRADEEAKRKAAEEAKRKADDEAKRKVDEEAKRKADEEAKRKADEEAKRKADEDAKRKADDEAAAVLAARAAGGRV